MKRLLLLCTLLFIGSFFLNARGYHHINYFEPRDTGYVKYLDTNTIVYTAEGEALRYYQYAKLITAGNQIVITKGDKKRQLVKTGRGLFGDGARDSIMAVNFNFRVLSPKDKSIPTWDRVLIKNLPKTIDTNFVMYDQDKLPLKFHQYFSLMFNDRGYFNISKGVKGIYRFSEYKNISTPPTLHNKADSVKKLAEVYLQLLQADNVLVIKSKRLIYLQRNAKTIMTIPCNLGGNPIGDKQQDGDRKTPEGFYRLEGKTTQVKYYKGYVISYPDSTHILAAKQKGVAPGGGIMIHGTSAQRSKAKDWTNGCMAISNAHMDSLFKYVTPQTPIEIRK